LVVGTPTSTFSKDEGFAAGVSMKLISLARLPVVVAILEGRNLDSSQSQLISPVSVQTAEVVYKKKTRPEQHV
jgi:hypothetical protein